MYICIASSDSLIRVHKTQHIMKVIVWQDSAWFPRILDTTFINYILFVIGTQVRIVKISNIRYTCALLYIL